jgi:hypothetical protein
MTGVSRSFSIAELVSREALRDRRRRNREADMALHVVRLFEHGAKSCQFLFTDGVSFNPQCGLSVSGPESGERTFHHGLGNGHFWLVLLQVLNGLGYGSTVFLAAFTGLIIFADDYPRAHETPEFFPTFLFFGSAPGSCCGLHGSFIFLHTGLTLRF